MGFCFLIGAIGSICVAVHGIRESYNSFKVDTVDVETKHSKGCYCGYCGTYCDTPFCKQCGAEQ